MTPLQFRNLVQHVAYKPNFTFFAEQIQYAIDGPLGTTRVAFSMRVPDASPGQLGQVTVHFSHYLSPEQLAPLNEHDALGLLHQWVRTMECHEMDEWFTYRGVKVYDPHREFLPVKKEP
jgi:hypothetical protein